jgi:hypothetical protein
MLVRKTSTRLRDQIDRSHSAKEGHSRRAWRRKSNVSERNDVPIRALASSLSTTHIVSMSFACTLAFMLCRTGCNERSSRVARVNVESERVS